MIQIIWLFLLFIPTFQLIPGLPIIPIATIISYVFFLVDRPKFCISKLAQSYFFCAIIFFISGASQFAMSTVDHSVESFIFPAYYLSLTALVPFLAFCNFNYSLKGFHWLRQKKIIHLAYDGIIIIASIQQICRIFTGIYIKANFRSVDEIIFAQTTPFSSIPFAGSANELFRQLGSSAPSVFGERVQLALLLFVFVSVSLLSIIRKNSQGFDLNPFFLSKPRLYVSLLLLSLSGSSINTLLIPLLIFFFCLSLFGKLPSLRRFKFMSFKDFLFSGLITNFFLLISFLLVFALFLPFIFNSFAAILETLDGGARLAGIISTELEIDKFFSQVPLPYALFGTGVIRTTSAGAFDPTLGIVGHSLTGWNYIVNGFGLLGFISFSMTVFISFQLGIENIILSLLLATLFILAAGSPLNYIYLYSFSLTLSSLAKTIAVDHRIE